MAKKKSAEDIYYPSPKRLKSDPGSGVGKQKCRKTHSSINRKRDYSIKSPDQWDYDGNAIKPNAQVTTEQMETAMHLIESLYRQMRLKLRSPVNSPLPIFEPWKRL